MEEATNMLLVDARERSLLSALSKIGTPAVTVNTANLDVGDIHLVVENTPMLIIERKSLSDLWASIKDGRYKEQAFRLNAAPVSSHHIIFLIEGDLERWGRSAKGGCTATSAMYSAMFSLSYFQGFSIWRTMNVHESAVLLLRFADKLFRSANKYGKFHEKFVSPPTPYRDVVTTQKKKNVTPEVAAHLMLRQIPGISGRATEALLNEYGSLANLMKALKEDPSCLDDLAFVSLTQKERRRKVSKTAIQNLKTFLLWEPDPIPDV